MSDLSQLMQYAPTVGAGFMGLNQLNAEREAEAKLTELAQLISTRAGQDQRQAQLHPLMMEQKRLENQKAQYDLPRIIAEAEGKQLDLDRTKATQQSTIDSTNFANNEKMQKAFMSQLGVISKELEGVPGVDRARYLTESFRQRGFPQPEEFLKRFSHIPVDQLPAALEALSQKHLRSNEQYAREIDQQGMRDKTALEAARISAGAQIQSARERGSRGGMSGELEDQINMELSKTRTIEGRMAILINGIVKAKQEGNIELATKLHAQATALKPAYDQKVNSQRAGQVDLGAQSGGRIQTAPPANTPIPSPTDTPATPAPAAPAAAAQGPGQIKAMVEAAGGNYQPDKFLYRIGPNGKVQAKPK